MNSKGKCTEIYESKKVCQSIKLGRSSIDGALEGGIRCGMITEIFGEGGSGKTQMCLQLALNVQLPPQLGGLYGVAIYYYSDYKFPMRRLQQLKDAICRTKSVGMDVVNLEDVVLCKVEDCKELCYRLGEMRRECLQRSETDRHVRLVVIDSIASLFRSQFVNTKEGMSQRKSYFTEITSTLRQYAKEFSMAVVITNQVTDVVVGATSTATGSSMLLSVYGQPIQPSLGTSWASGLDTRIFLGIMSAKNDEEHGGETMRLFKIIYSHYLESNECAFSITRDGIS